MRPPSLNNFNTTCFYNSLVQFLLCIPELINKKNTPDGKGYPWDMYELLLSIYNGEFNGMTKEHEKKINKCRLRTEQMDPIEVIKGIHPIDKDARDEDNFSNKWFYKLNCFYYLQYNYIYRDCGVKKIISDTCYNKINNNNMLVDIKYNNINNNYLYDQINDKFIIDELLNKIDCKDDDNKNYLTKILQLMRRNTFDSNNKEFIFNPSYDYEGKTYKGQLKTNGIEKFDNYNIDDNIDDNNKCEPLNMNITLTIANNENKEGKYIIFDTSAKNIIMPYEINISNIHFRLKAFIYHITYQLRHGFVPPSQKGQVSNYKPTANKETYGHYIAYTRYNNQWYSCNDKIIKREKVYDIKELLSIPDATTHGNNKPTTLLYEKY